MADGGPPDTLEPEMLEPRGGSGAPSPFPQWATPVPLADTGDEMELFEVV